MRKFKLLRIIGATIALAGCSDATAPSGVTGAWALRSVDGRSVDVPPPGSVTPYPLTHELLTLNAGGSFDDRYDVKYIDVPSGAVLDTQSYTLTGNWRLEDATVHLLYGTTDEAGTVSRDTLRFGTAVYTRP